MRLFALSLLALGTVLFAGCSSNKGSARLYEGDAPNIRYSESHAGGPLRN